MGIFFSLLFIIAAIIFTFVLTGTGGKQKKAFNDAIATYRDLLINESIKKFQSLLYEEPYNSLYHWYLGLLFLQKQDYNSAEYHFENILQIKNYTIPDPDLPDIQNFNENGVRHRLMSIYQTLNLNDKLASQLEKLFEAEPGNDTYPLTLAEIFLAKKDYSDATKTYLEKAISINPKNARALFYLSLVYLKNQKFDEALQSAEKSITLDKSLSDAYFIMGYLRYRLNLKDEAERLFREASLCRFFRKSNAFYLSKILSSAGKLDNAVSYAREAVKYTVSAHEDPSMDLEARYLLATLLEQQDQFTEALELYKYLENVRPGYQDVSKRLKYMNTTKPAAPAMSAHIKADLLETFKEMRVDELTHTSEKIMENLGYRVKKVDIVNDQTVNMTVTEQTGGSSTPIGVFIRRGIGILQEEHVKNILHFMSGHQVRSAFLITPNDFNPEARKMAEKKAIKTINGEKLRELLKSVPS